MIHIEYIKGYKNGINDLCLYLNDRFVCDKGIKINRKMLQSLLLLIISKGFETLKNNDIIQNKKGILEIYKTT